MSVAYFTNIQTRQDISGHYSIKESKDDLGSYSFGEMGCEHPMDPQRLRMVHSLILSLGLGPFLTIHPSLPCGEDSLRFFHSREYLDFLANVNDEKIKSKIVSIEQTRMHNIGPVADGIDCTAFPGVWEYNRTIAGASVSGANLIRTGKARIAINWSGGMHHAKISNAAGFCYLNDCVLAILELLKSMNRVLYIDMDFHHGDGVEEAFYITDKVFTLSFHRFAPRVFPGTGCLSDTGAGVGKGYSANVPLLAGIGDIAYFEIFQKVVGAVVAQFNPEAIVLQAGADSLVGDAVGIESGGFNISTKGHSKCVEYVKNLHIPLLVLGGGGYSKTSVAKCWAIETGILCGKNIFQTSVPETDFYFKEYKDKSLHISGKKDCVDFNSPGRIELIVRTVLSNIGTSASSS